MIILLDVDGVVVAAPPDGGHWSDGLEAEMGVSPEALRDAFFDPFWTEIVTGQADLMPRLQAALTAIGSDVSAATLLEYWLAQDATLDMNVLQDVARLRAAGAQAWLATNQEHHRAEYLLETLGLAVQFDGIVYSAEVGAKKPTPKFFEACCAATGAAPQDHLLVDDTPRNVDGAKAFGCQAVLWEKGMSMWRVAHSG